MAHHIIRLNSSGIDGVSEETLRWDGDRVIVATCRVAPREPGEHDVCVYSIARGFLVGPCSSADAASASAQVSPRQCELAQRALQIAVDQTKIPTLWGLPGGYSLA